MSETTRWVRFWIIGQDGDRGEAWMRLRSWWRRHWWPARIRQLDQERRYWEDRVKLLEGALHEVRSLLTADAGGHR